jgi:hypothetical protein
MSQNPITAAFEYAMGLGSSADVEDDGEEDGERDDTVDLGRDNDDDDDDDNQSAERNVVLDTEPDAEDEETNSVSSDSGAEEDMLHTPRGVPPTPALDSDAFAEFDYAVQIQDFENFEEFNMREFEGDLSVIESMDFSQFLV